LPSFPDYWLRKYQEEKIKFDGHSSLSDEDHPERVSLEKEVVVEEKKKEKAEAAVEEVKAVEAKEEKEEVKAAEVKEEKAEDKKEEEAKE